MTDDVLSGFAPEVAIRLLADQVEAEARTTKEQARELASQALAHVPRQAPVPTSPVEVEKLAGLFEAADALTGWSCLTSMLRVSRAGRKTAA